MATSIANTQESLAILDQTSSLSIIKLSESLLASDDTETDTNRSSDVSADNGYVDISPASLRADLVHYEVF
jgi:hypothetical protein